MMKTRPYRYGPLFFLLLLPACSGPTGPTDEQVSHDVVSFLQDKCAPLGASETLRPVVVTSVRIGHRNLTDQRAEIVATAEGRLDANATYRGYVFSDYCPVGSDHRSQVSVAYAFRNGTWHFDGALQNAGAGRASLNTASSEGTMR
jgi:hypothetical protein